MFFRSSVVSTRPLVRDCPITKWKRLLALARNVLLAVVLVAVPAIASAGLNTINIISGNGQAGATGTILPDPLTVEYRNSAGALIPGGSVIFTVTAGDAALDKFGSTQRFITTDGAGRAMVSAHLGNTPGPVTVEVTDFSSSAPAIFNLTATAPNNSISVISGDNQQASVGQPFEQPLIVELRDGQGMLPIGVRVTFEITRGSATFDNGQFSFSATTGKVGRAAASLVAGDQQGQVSIRIRADGYTDAAAGAFVSNFGANPSVSFTDGEFQDTSVNTPFPMPLVATVDDGVPRSADKGGTAGTTGTIPDVPVTFTVLTGNAVFSANGQSSITVNSDAGGQASVFVDATSPEGDVVIEATADTFRPDRTQGLRIVGADGTIQVQGGDGQALAPGDTTLKPLVAMVQDSAAQPVAGVTVSYRVLDLGLTPPVGITVEPASGVSGSDGLVDFVVSTTAKTANGDYRIEAAALGYSPAYFSLRVSDKAGFVSFDITRGNNQSGPTNKALPVPFEVQALDTGKGSIPIRNVVVTFDVSSGSASIQGGSGKPVQTFQVLTDANGFARAMVTPEDPGGPFQVTASANIFNTDFVEVFDGSGIPAAPPTLTIVSGDGQSGQPNTILASPIVAEFRDSAGAPIVKGVVHFRINSGDALLQPVGGSNPSSLVQVTTDSLGRAAVEMVLGATPGPVQAEAGGDPDFVVNAPFGATIVAAPPTLTIVSGDAQSGLPNSTSANPLVAEYRDGNGNVVPGHRLVVEITSGNALVQERPSGSPATSIVVFTDGSGQVLADILFGPTPGAVTGRVVDPAPVGQNGTQGVFGLAAPAPFTATITAAPSTLTITGGNNQSAPPNTTLPDPLSVRLLDGAGAPVNGASVFYTVTAGDAAFSNGQTTFVTSTNATGDAAATLTFGPAQGPVTVTANADGQSVTFNLTSVVPNVAPTITYNPPAGSAFALSADGASAFGNITATPSGGSGSGSLATTTVGNCSFATNSASFAVTGAPLTFEGNTTTSGTLSLSCQVGPGAVTARLTCTETRGIAAEPVPVFFDVTCPAAPTAPTITITGGDAQSGPPNTTAPQPLAAQYRDGAGNPVSGQQLLVEITSGNAQVRGRPSGTASTAIVVATDSMGQILVDILFGATPGAVTGFISEFRPVGQNGPQGLPAPAAPAPFTATITAAPSTLTITGGNNQSAPPNTTLPDPLSVRLLNGAGAPVNGASVFYTVTGGDATFSNGQTTFVTSTNATGDASATLTFGPSQGPVTVTVGADGQTVTFNETIVAPAPGTISIVSGNNQSGAPGTDSAPLRVQLTPIRASEPVTFRVLSGSGALLNANGNASSQVIVTTDPDGTASVVFRYGNSPGPVRIEASAQGFGSIVFDLAVLGQPPNDVFRIVSGNGQSGAPGTQSQPLVVELLRNGSPAAGETINWFVRSGDAQVENFATTIGSDGRSSNRITFGQTLGPIVLEARTGDGLGSVQFNLTTVAPSSLDIRLLSGGGQSGPVNSPFDSPLVFEVSNAQGQPQSNVLVSFAVTRGSATLNVNSATTDVAGRVSVGGRYGPNAGPIDVRASIGSGTAERSAIATLTSFAPGLNIVSGNNQSGPVGTALPAPLVVEVTRPAGFTGSLAGFVLRWTVIEGGGTVVNATTTTDAAGRATNALTLGAQPGANRVRVDADGGGSVTFMATAGAAAAATVRLEIVSGNNQDVATNTDSLPLVVRVVDVSTGAPRPNSCVAFSSPTPGVTLSLSQVGSDANGLAQVIARLNDVGPAIVTAQGCTSGAVGQVVFALNGAIENTLGLDPNDRTFGIAQAFDNACFALRSLLSSGATLNAGQTDLLARCDDFEFNSGGNPDEVIEALEQILGDEAEAQNNAAFNVAAAQFDNLKARIAALRSGTNGSSFGGLALQGGNGSVPLSFASTVLNATETAAAPAEVGSDFDRWGFFATGTIGDGDRDPEGGSSGFDFETRGLTAGVDYRYSDSLIVGAALGYASNDTQIGANRGELETTGWSISGYSTFYKGDSWYADGVLTYGSNQYDIRRNIAFSLATPGGTPSAVNQVNTASPDGSQFSASFTGGRDFQRGAWSVGPYARWQYTTVDFEGYTETVSNPGTPGQGLTLTVNDREVKSMQGVLGGKASFTMSTAWGILIPHFQFEYVREFKDDPDALTSTLVFDPTGTQIAVSGSEIDQSFMNLGLGLSAVFTNGRSAFLYYEKLLGQQGTSKDSIAIGIRIEF